MMLKTVLRRFTNMTSLIHMLQTRKITLLDPASWDDKNDAHFMAEYKRKIHAKTVLALCFTKSNEKYHHWRVFAGTPDGVAIDIERESLIGMLRNTQDVEVREVSYKKINELKAVEEFDVGDLPFLKRGPYVDEMEYRAVYINREEVVSSLDLDIDVRWIKRIALSPWMPAVQKNSIVNALKSFPDCEKLHIVRSGLVENVIWREMASKAT